MNMIELDLVWAWARARIDKIREDNEEGGFSTLEWVGIAGIVVVAAIVVATILMNKAKSGADNVNVQ